MTTVIADTQTIDEARNLIESANATMLVYADDIYRGARHKRANWRDMVHYGLSQTFAHMDAPEYTLTVFTHKDERTTLTTAVVIILRVYDGEYYTLGAELVYADILSKMYHSRNGRATSAVERVQREARMRRLRPLEYKTFAETERNLIAAL